MTLKQLSEQIVASEKHTEARINVLSSLRQFDIERIDKLEKNVKFNVPQASALDKYIPLPIAQLPYNGWRKVFPTNLRNAKVVQAVYGLFKHKDEVWEVQEQWERVHAGEIIDLEWRPLAKSHFVYED